MKVVVASDMTAKRYVFLLILLFLHPLSPLFYQRSDLDQSFERSHQIRRPFLISEQSSWSSTKLQIKNTRWNVTQTAQYSEKDIHRLSKTAWAGSASMTESVIGNFPGSFHHLIPPEKVKAFPHIQVMSLKKVG